MVNELRRLTHALGYSLAGLKAAYQHEAAFRLEIRLAIILVPTASWLPISLVSKALLISSIILIILMELLNSAIEAIVDRVSLEHHPLAKRAKDIGSAAVLLALVNFGVIWGAVLLTL